MTYEEKQDQYHVALFQDIQKVILEKEEIKQLYEICCKDDDNNKVDILDVLDEIKGKK